MSERIPESDTQKNNWIIFNEKLWKKIKIYAY